MTPHDLRYDIIIHYLCVNCAKISSLHHSMVMLCHHVWRVPLILLVYAFVPLCEIISGVLFALDHLTASFTLNSFLCNSLSDPVTYDWLQLLAV